MEEAPDSLGHSEEDSRHDNTCFKKFVTNLNELLKERKPYLIKTIKEVRKKNKLPYAKSSKYGFIQLLLDIKSVSERIGEPQTFGDLYDHFKEKLISIYGQNSQTPTP